MASAAATAQPNQRRRLSLTTLGLSGSPTQTSPFGGRIFRRESLSSSVGSNSFEEAVAEDTEGTSPGATPNSPFARRLSFGAQALREVRGGSLGNGRLSPPGPPSSSTVACGRRTASAAASSTLLPAASSASKAPSHKVEPSNPLWRSIGEGFNWSEALRARAERAPSVAGNSASPPAGPSQAQQSYAASQHGHHQRAASIAVMEPPGRELPKQPKQNKPDFFQEKILRGDFMD